MLRRVHDIHRKNLTHADIKKRPGYLLARITAQCTTKHTNMVYRMNDCIVQYKTPACFIGCPGIFLSEFNCCPRIRCESLLNCPGQMQKSGQITGFSGFVGFFGIARRTAQNRWGFREQTSSRRHSFCRYFVKTLT